MTFYLIAYEPHPSADGDFIADSIKTLFPEHWLFTGTTWIVRTDKPAPVVRDELTALLGHGRLLCIVLPETAGKWYTTGAAGPLWAAQFLIGEPESDARSV